MARRKREYTRGTKEDVSLVQPMTSHAREAVGRAQSLESRVHTLLVERSFLLALLTRFNVNYRDLPSREEIMYRDIAAADAAWRIATQPTASEQQ